MKQKLLGYCSLVLITLTGVTLAPKSANAQTPSIVSFTPTSGPIGTPITLFGSNYSAVLTNNIVTFGGVTAPVVSGSTNQLSVVVPAGAMYAPISITTDGCIGTAPNPFLVTFPSCGLFNNSSLDQHVSLRTGNGPVSLQTADLDGDGKLDIVVANYWDNTLSIFRNISTNGSLSSNSFAPAVTIPTGRNPFCISLADIDGDGKFDIVVPNRDEQTVAIFRNISSPGVLTATSFESGIVIPIGSTSWQVVVGDLDADGHPELVIPACDANCVYVVKNTSTQGHVSFAPKVAFQTKILPSSAVITDIDGDGKPDLAVTSYESGVLSLLHNTTTPGVIDTTSFASMVNFSTGASPIFVVAADLDNDGKLDLIVGERNEGMISLFRNTSVTGIFSSNTLAQRVALSTDGSTQRIGVGDINGDGKIDLFAPSEESGAITVYQNIYTNGIFSKASFAPSVKIPGGPNPCFVNLSDLDGDGRADMLVANFSFNTISVFRNLMDNTPPVPTVPPSISAQPLDQTSIVGGTITLSVTADGSAPLRFQWKHNGIMLPDATNSTLILANLQVSDAGDYQVTVSNPYGFVSSSKAVVTVKTSVVQVDSVTATGGSTFLVPIRLLAIGTENAASFSLNFDPNILTLISVDIGKDVANGSLFANTNMESSGKVGVILAMPAGLPISAGTDEIAVLQFQASPLTTNAECSLNFGDQPTVRRLVDVNVNSLTVGFSNGIVHITRAPFESDLSPRSGGDSACLIDDWVQVGRFVSGLDTINSPSEFQRADCAPRQTLGNGRISISDWVQAGRYAAGLDPLTLAGGPTAPVNNLGLTRKSSNKSASSRFISLTSAESDAAPCVVCVEMAALGSENALGFSLNFNPTELAYVGASLCKPAQGMQLNINTNAADVGTLGFCLALPAGQTFSSGPQQLIRVEFAAKTSNSKTTVIRFSDTPVWRELADVNGESLYSEFSDKALSINGNSIPMLNIAIQSTNVILSWPKSATEFTLESRECEGTSWTKVTGSTVTNGSIISVTVPRASQMQLYRLKH